MTRLAGMAAMGFALVVTAINLLLRASGWPPAADAAPGEVGAYFAGHTALIGMDVSVSLLNTLLLATFGAGAFATIWPVERGRGEAWSVVGLVGIAAMPALFGGVVAIRAALLAGHDPAGGLWDLHSALFTANSIGLALVLIGFSIGGMRTATIRPWHGSLGVASGALLSVAAALTPALAAGAPAGLAAFGLVGFLGWLVWLFTFGTVLVRA